ncbi:hypothetical protein [Chryseobacterium sp.]|uniref:hypothetical protein n=1 Tax=Chryseobacterium sp. TaxID=1871047 RepID=UPI0011C96E26|nr:hypothetical protein [Chryseobacterium sp.]TXF75916.1 hypothetical protein FUA25_08405 [Chryseobacterium sp.]
MNHEEFFTSIEEDPLLMYLYNNRSTPSKEILLDYSELMAKFPADRNIINLSVDVLVECGVAIKEQQHKCGFYLFEQ